MIKEFVNVFPNIVVLTRSDMILGGAWDDIWNWSKEQSINVIFRNHWSDECGEHYSFEIEDATQRTWFTLRYK
jgi:hypothetical protein